MSYANQRWAIPDENDNDRLKIVTLDEWAKWMGAHRKERILGRDEIDGYTVSTIFLGLDHQWIPDGRPLYWETCIFDPLGRKQLEKLRNLSFIERYSTAKEAREGHAAAIMWLKGLLKKH